MELKLSEKTLSSLKKRSRCAKRIVASEDNPVNKNENYITPMGCHTGTCSGACTGSCKGSCKTTCKGIGMYN